MNAPIPRPPTSASLVLLVLALAACAPAPDETAAPVVPDRSAMADAPADTRVDVATTPAAPSSDDAASRGVDGPVTGDDGSVAAIPAELASFACRGTDPEWSLALSPEGAALHIDDTDHALPGELRQTPTGAWTWLSAPDEATTESYALLLSPSACFPGEGRRAEPYIAELSLPDGRRATGCCAPATAE